MTSTEGELWPPLAAIRAKEVQLKDRILEAKRKAERLVREAQEEAQGIRERAEGDAAQEAKPSYAENIVKVEAQAAEIRAAGKKEAETLRSRGRKNVEEAARRIVETVLD